MENKINVAELLKGCPKGMELDCTMFEGVYFDCIDDVSDIIKCYIQDSKHKICISFNKYGHYSNISKTKCVIFPKGKDTWEGFQRPFKDGDIVATENGLFIGIVKVKNNMQVGAYCAINNLGSLSMNTKYYFDRLATEEERQKLFKAIKDNGCRWNAENKTLEKLIEPKFDITTLKPFDKVLVRDNVEQKWIIDFFGFMNNDKGFPFVCVGHYVTQCIPYEKNEHLLGATDDCDEYYKTWE